MKNRLLLFLSIVSILLYGVSCKKGPGLGGEGSIRGKVSGILYNKSFTTKLDSGYVGNWTVNILYGDDVAIDANQKTSYDGSFEFQYLRKGHYTIFVYSRSYKTNLQDSVLVLETDITGKRQVLDLPIIKILR